jgi:hypothetical protein
MTKINEKTFLQELLQTIPEFREIHENAKYHDIGIHIIFGDFRRFTENTIEQDNKELFKRIKDFIIRCHIESKDEINNAVFVSFFENMDEKPLEYFLDSLPSDFTEEVRGFLKAFDEASAKGAKLRNSRFASNS